MPKTYNGWYNYETWLCNLWFENFDFTDYVKDGTFDEMNMDGILEFITDHIKEYVYEFVYETQSHGGFVDNMINASLESVNFRDIAEHYIDDLLVDIGSECLTYSLSEFIEREERELVHQSTCYQGPQ